jgi:hypothetical protein
MATVALLAGTRSIRKCDFNTTASECSSNVTKLSENAICKSGA